MQEGWRILSCGISNTADYCKEFIAQMKKRRLGTATSIKKNKIRLTSMGNAEVSNGVRGLSALTQQN